MGILSLGLTIYSLWVLGTDSVSNLLLSLPAKCMDPSLKPPGGLMSRKGKFLPSHHRSLGHPVLWNAATRSCDESPGQLGYYCASSGHSTSRLSSFFAPLLAELLQNSQNVKRWFIHSLLLHFHSSPLPLVPTIPRFLDIFICLICPPSSSKWKWKSLSCVRLCDPMDYTVRGILQARILEWVAVPFSKGSSQPRDQTQVFRVAGGFFTNWAMREAPSS